MRQFKANFYTIVKAPANTSDPNGYLFSNGKYRTKIVEDDLPDEYVKVVSKEFPVVFIGIDKIHDCIKDEAKGIVLVSFDKPINEFDVTNDKGEKYKKYGGYALTVKLEEESDFVRFCEKIGVVFRTV